LIETVEPMLLRVPQAAVKGFMQQMSVIYSSMTGNTEKVASAIHKAQRGSRAAAIYSRSRRQIPQAGGYELIRLWLSTYEGQI
jgi:flavodoxin